MWLNCYSQHQIAKEIDNAARTIRNWIDEIGKKEKKFKFSDPPGKTDRQPWGNIQHFDIWNFAKSDSDSSYFGQMPPQVVENLLWFYTEPGQVVFDPFAGGGTTINVAKAMGRRVWSSDIKLSTPMLPIHEHNILDGWPAKAPTQTVLNTTKPPGRWRLVAMPW